MPLRECVENASRRKSASSASSLGLTKSVRVDAGWPARVRARGPAPRHAPPALRQRPGPRPPHASRIRDGARVLGAPKCLQERSRSEGLAGPLLIPRGS
eukprot:1649065-Rhodomonas_salina.1